MSTIAMDQAHAPKPLPWLRMIWVTWRQHRIALLGVATAVATAAGFLLVSGGRIHAAWVATHVDRCFHGQVSIQCVSAFVQLNRGFGGSAIGITVLHAVPGLIGMFVGAPLLAREFELGTAPFVWCQGITPLRWTVAKLVLVGGAVSAAVVPIGVLFAWWYPSGSYVLWDNTVMLWGDLPYPVTEYDLFPAPYVRWTMLAFALGALAGALLRRTLPAMVLTGAGYTVFLVFATSLNYSPVPRFWPWLLTEGNGLLVYTGLLVAVLLWLVHRRAGLANRRR
jgi:hypothetical protein